MKATAETFTSDVIDGATAKVSWGATLSELFKARLSAMVLITSAVGFYSATRGAMEWSLMLQAMGGTALLAAGAAALNQYLERDHDARMQRTAHRPIPSGRVTPMQALGVGVLVSVVGMAWLTLAVNPLTGFLGVLTLASYLFVYTPLKRVTTLNTLVGAVPGALPPLMGWTAATGEIQPGGWALFTLLFFWQLPHFMAIAWLYREDYAKGGFRMLPVVDQDGRRTASTAIRHTVALAAFSLAPFSLGMAGRWYLAGAIVLGAVFFVCAVRFAVQLSRERARALFLASIIYLPLLLSLLVVDKIRS